MSRVRSRNKSPYGWWLASYVMRQVWDDVPDPSPRSRCLAWEDTIVLQAADRNAAFRKALKIAELDASGVFTNEAGNRAGHWVLDGLTSLLPIYEPLEDGSEILWREYRGRTVATIQKMARNKESLEAFGDDSSQ